METKSGEVKKIKRTWGCRGGRDRNILVQRGTYDPSWSALDFPSCKIRRLRNDF